jgi:hypothetical protein
VRLLVVDAAAASSWACARLCRRRWVERRPPTPGLTSAVTCSMRGKGEEGGGQGGAWRRPTAGGGGREKREKVEPSSIPYEKL